MTLPRLAEAVAADRSAAPAGRRTALLSPTLDVLLIGGASLVLFVCAWLFVDRSAKTSQISWAAFYMAFIVNNPHFMASYMLLYWDKRKELLRNRSFLWAAVVAPALVIGYLVAAVAAGSPRYLGYAVNFMFFTVGWHYVKQIYGTVIVTSSRRQYYLSKPEARVLKGNLYFVWAMSFINGNAATRSIMQYGIGYDTFEIPGWVRDVNLGLVVLSFAGLAVMLFRKYLRDGKMPGWPAILSFVSIYVWYAPTLYHAHFWYFIPFFHSLQYMLFVWALKRNQYKAEALAAAPTDAPRQRALFSRDYLGFLALITVTAALSFKLLPEFLDSQVMYDEKVFGKELYMFCFITFINIHHYFIDNVIWRRDNPALKQHLFGA